MTANKTRVELDRLLQLRNEQPEQAAEVDAQIQATFTEIHAILVLDMAGFSRYTMRYGIIHFLAALQRLSAIAIPLIAQHQGTLVKQEADNIFAVFTTVESAMDAAIAILEQLAVVNVALPTALALDASIGIGYGEVLMIDGKDMFGNEMNLASKLGEDLARPNEILLTEAAFQQLHTPRYSLEPLELSIAGLELTTYKVLR